MRRVIELQSAHGVAVEELGGKAVRLAAMARAGFVVPAGFCISAEAYREFLRATRLGERVRFELARKPFEEMRWEEIWDAALRIRNLFRAAEMPAELAEEIVEDYRTILGECAVAVRSSSRSEDSADRSFAGLHESYIDVRGPRALLEKVKLVWASLWSDRALLYLREIGLDVASSAMPVLVQEMRLGDSSGVAFSRSPDGADRVVIEAVFGLNQGLVDGVVQPDRWILDRQSGEVLSQSAPERREALLPAAGEPRRSTVEGDRPPLTGAGVHQVFELALQAEANFSAPQDVEWTMEGERLVALQSRPITTLPQEDERDKRPWYLTLTRTFEDLKALQRLIEEEDLPGMEAEAEHLAQVELGGLGDAALAAEIERRQEAMERWRAVYWRDCIPFAHGMRLFGQIYNDRLAPADPHEFIDLLGTANLAGLERNRRLAELAEALRRGESIDDRLDPFIEDYGFLSRPDAGGSQGELERGQLLELLQEMARSPAVASPQRDHDVLLERYFAAFDEEEQAFAQELLDLGRASYRLRDDDNIYLERVEHQLDLALAEGRRRTEPGLDADDLTRCLRDPSATPRRRAEAGDASPALTRSALKMRQLVGQPAGPGAVTGPARVIDEPAALFQFKRGEVLVCDAVDPSMTFVVPLAAAVVERRGGMLIHGAIIAREYGLPCVTGVPEATALIETGDQLTVDGYLGLVIVDRE